MGGGVDGGVVQLSSVTLGSDAPVMGSSALPCPGVPASHGETCCLRSE